MASVTTIDGHIPNYVNPETKVPLLLGVQISLTAAALVVVLLRLYTRKYIRNTLTAEDWVTVASMVRRRHDFTFTQHPDAQLTYLGAVSDIDLGIMSW